PAGSARADGSCTRLSALTGGLRVPSCKGPRGRRPGVKTVPDRGLTSAQTLQPLAQLRQKSPKASIVRGSLQFRAKVRCNGCTGNPTEVPQGLPLEAFQLQDRSKMNKVSTLLLLWCYTCYTSYNSTKGMGLCMRWRI